MPRHHNINGNIVPFTAEEEAQRDAEEQAWNNGAFDRAMEDLRQRRNRLLANCDWEVIMAKEKGTTLSAGFKTYRQDLRDITEGLTTVEEVEAVEFPTKP
tara:strand:- start:246 stop:545 length:300 start_codon:yes stop_codon:yes gene_type:complete